MRIGIRFLLAVCFCLHNYSESYTVDDKETLINELFQDYNKKLHPPYNNSETLEVDVNVMLMAIKDYDDVMGELSTVAAFLLTWTDYRLEWNSTDHNGIDSLILPRTDVWYPEINVINSAKEFTVIAKDEPIITRVYPTGKVKYAASDDLSTVCESDMTYFPFDKQTCIVRIAVWGHYAYEINLNFKRPDVDLLHYSKNSLWDIVSTKTEQFSYGGDHTLAQFQVTIKRKPAFFCLNMIAPIVLLVFLNPLVFLLPFESGERTSYAVTIFLTIAVFMTLITDSLPKTSSPMPNVSFFLLISIIYSTIIVVVNMFNLRIYYWDSEKEFPTLAKTIANILRFQCLMNCRSCKKNVVEEFKKPGIMENSCAKLAKTFDRIALTYSFLFVALLLLTCPIFL